MDWNTIVSTLFGVAVGGVITFFVSRYYYVRASKELEREAEVIKHYVNALIAYLAEAGLIKPRRDKAGNLLAPVGAEADIRWNVESTEEPDNSSVPPEQER